MPDYLKPLLSRKFIAAMSALASAHYLVSHAHISDGVYSTIVVATVGALMTANVAQKVLTKEVK